MKWSGAFGHSRLTWTEKKNPLLRVEQRALSLGAVKPEGSGFCEIGKKIGKKASVEACLSHRSGEFISSPVVGYFQGRTKGGGSGVRIEVAEHTGAAQRVLAVRGVELAVDVLDVRVDGVRADAEFVADFLVDESV